MNYKINDKNLFPATTLKEDCYSNMFNVGSSHVEKPIIMVNEIILPATVLPNRCYRQMIGLADIATTLKVDLRHVTYIGAGALYCSFPNNTEIHLGTSLTEVYGDLFGGANYKVYYHFEETDTPQFDLSKVLTQATASKNALSYSIYTNNTAIKNACLAKANEYTTVNVYHLDGSAWEE